MSRSPSPNGPPYPNHSPSKVHLERGPAMLQLFEKIRMNNPQILEISLYDFLRSNSGNFGLCILNDDEMALFCAALSLNTCIVSLNLSNQKLGSSGAAVIMGAITHLTSLTHLDLTYNDLSADDIAMIFGTAAAAGMSQLHDLQIQQSCHRVFCSLCGADETLCISAVIASETWREYQLPLVPDFMIALTTFYHFGDLLQYVMSEDRAAFAANYHPMLPLHLMTGITSSLPHYTEIKFHHVKGPLCARGAMILAPALSLNTCIVSLNLSNQKLGSSGAAVIMGAITHLTSLTHLDLTYNDLSADDIAMIFGTAAAAGMSQLHDLQIYQHSDYIHYSVDDIPPIYQSLSAVVASDTWQLLHMPSVPHEFIDMVSEPYFGDLLQYVMSEDRAAFAANYHPMLPLHLMTGIASNLPHYTEIKLREKRADGFVSHKMRPEDCLCLRGAMILATALSLNTCIVSLNLSIQKLGSSGAAVIMGAITHLTSLTHLDLTYNDLSADDIAMIFGTAAAAGMSQLMELKIRQDNDISSVRLFVPCIVTSETWRWLKLPSVPNALAAVITDGDLLQYVMSEDRAAFAANYHPKLPVHLMTGIASSLPHYTEIKLWLSFGECPLCARGAMILASALSLNTCIVSLSLSIQKLGSSGAAVIMGAITHLTSLTHLDLTYNDLSADDIAMICGTAAAAGMSQLRDLLLHEKTVSASQVVASETWQQMKLPPVSKRLRLISSTISEHHHSAFVFGQHSRRENWVRFCDFIKNSRVLLHACQAIACSRKFSFAPLNVPCARLTNARLPKILSQHQQQRLIASGGIVLCLVCKMNAVNCRAFRPQMDVLRIAASFARGPLFGIIRRVKSAAATTFSPFSAPAVHQQQEAGTAGCLLHVSRSSISAACTPRCNWPVMTDRIIMNPSPDSTASAVSTILLVEAYREYICHRRFAVLNERDPHRRRYEAISLCRHLGLFGPDVFCSAEGGSSEFWPLHLKGVCTVIFVEMARVAPIARPLNDHNFFDLVGDVVPFVFQSRDLPALGAIGALQPVSHEAIVLAVRNGFSAAVVQLLLVAGFSANSTAASGLSVLGLASQNGFLHLVELLIQWNADVNFVPVSTDEAITPLLLAASNGHAHVLQLLIRSGARPSSDACAAASAGGYSECVELLKAASDFPEESKAKHARVE